MGVAYRDLTVTGMETTTFTFRSKCQSKKPHPQLTHPYILIRNPTAEQKKLVEELAQTENFEGTVNGVVKGQGFKVARSGRG